MYVLSVQYSCAVVQVFLFGGKANLVLLTLFYSTLLTLTDRQTDRRTEKQNNPRRAGTLASRGLEEPAHALRGLEEPFFQLCCCVSFWFWQQKGFGCTYYYVLGVPTSCGVVLVFLVLVGNSFWCYVRTQCTIQLCDCVILVVVVGKLILYNYLTSGGCAIVITTKKNSSRLSGGCAIVITTGKKFQS